MPKYIELHYNGHTYRRYSCTNRWVCVFWRDGFYRRGPRSAWVSGHWVHRDCSSADCVVLDAAWHESMPLQAGRAQYAYMDRVMAFCRRENHPLIEVFAS